VEIIQFEQANANRNIPIGKKEALNNAPGKGFQRILVFEIRYLHESICPLTRIKLQNLGNNSYIMKSKEGG
jgi:hypothetical protein